MSHLTVRISDKIVRYFTWASFARTSISNRELAIMPDILSLRLWKTAVTKKRKGKNAITDTSGFKGTSLILFVCSCLCHARRLRYFILYNVISVLCLCHFHNLALREASKLTVARICDSISFTRKVRSFLIP